MQLFYVYGKREREKVVLLVYSKNFTASSMYTTSISTCRVKGIQRERERERERKFTEKKKKQKVKSVKWICSVFEF